MQLENAIYSVIHKRKNIRVSFAEHPELWKINEFYTYTLGAWWQIKIKLLETGHYSFWKCFIQGAPCKKQYHCFFHGEPKIKKKTGFYTFTLAE